MGGSSNLQNAINFDLTMPKRRHESDEEESAEERNTDSEASKRLPGSLTKKSKLETTAAEKSAKATPSTVSLVESQHENHVY
jgi:hypothetical protein